jgi:hypothetical protein
MDRVRELLPAAPAIHADETPARSGGAWRALDGLADFAIVESYLAIAALSRYLDKAAYHGGAVIRDCPGQLLSCSWPGGLNPS